MLPKAPDAVGSVPRRGTDLSNTPAITSYIVVLDALPVLGFTMSLFINLIQRLKPETVNLAPAERNTSAFAAAVCIAATAWLAAALGASSPLLVAAIGASAVLLLALPASPLAQPWALVGSYLVSGLAGVTAARYVPSVPLAAAAAVGGATLGMLWLRCLHPPGGAVALYAVMGGAPLHEAGYSYLLHPVLSNALLLLATAWLANYLLPGRRYPRPLPERAPHAISDLPPLQRMGLRPEDVKAALAEFGQALYVGADELDRLIELAERRAFERRHGDRRCGEIMTRDVATIQGNAPLLHAWRLLRSRRLPALVVVDSLQRVEGLLSLDNFVHATRAHSPSGLRDRMVLLLRHQMSRDQGVASIMSAAPATTTADAHVATLVPLLAGRAHFVPVVDAKRQLVGVVTQSDLIAALYQSHLAEGE